MEATIEGPVEPERIRVEARRDSGLDDGDKGFVRGREGVYPADQGRERRARAGPSDYDLDDVHEEDEKA